MYFYRPSLLCLCLGLGAALGFFYDIPGVMEAAAAEAEAELAGHTEAQALFGEMGCVLFEQIPDDHR